MYSSLLTHTDLGTPPFELLCGERLEPDGPSRLCFPRQCVFQHRSHLSSSNGIAGFLYGASTQCGASCDQLASAGTRNFLFASISQSGFTNSDLIAFVSVDVSQYRTRQRCGATLSIFSSRPHRSSFEDIVTRNAPADLKLISATSTRRPKLLVKMWMARLLWMTSIRL